MDDNIISHPRLIEQKERELEEFERQIEIKRNALFRDYEILRLRTSTFDNTRRRHALEILFAFVAGVVCGTALLMMI
jgi:hypothetical protein